MEEGNDNHTDEPEEVEQPLSGHEDYGFVGFSFSPEQKGKLAQRFSLDNFQLVRPPKGEDYVRVTLPRSVETAVRALRIRLLQDSMRSVDFVSDLVGTIRTLDQSIRDHAAALNLSEEEEIALRQNPKTAKFLDMLGGPGEESADQRHRQNLRKGMHNTMLLNFSELLIIGLGNAMSQTFDKFYNDRLRELREQGVSEGTVEIVLYEEVMKGQRPYEEMRDLIYPFPQTMNLATRGKVGNEWEQACRFVIFDSKGELFFKHPEDLVEPEDVNSHIIKGELPQKKFRPYKSKLHKTMIYSL